MASRSARAASAAGCVAGLLIAAGVAMGAATTGGGGARPEPIAAPEAVSPNDPNVLDRLMEIATRDALRDGEAPVVRRTRLLERIRNGHQCFVGNPTPEQLENIAAMYGGRNPSERMGGINNRFFLNGSSWDGSGASVVPMNGLAKPISLLTYSFPNDGVVWGPQGQLNRLSADLTGQLMADPPIIGPGVAYGRELFRQVMANWQRACGVRYMEVCDDDAPLDLVPPAGPGTHGDIRFGSYSLGVGTGVLAFNYYPEAGGDMVLNSDYFTPFAYYSGGGTNGYRYLRNAIAHEHGHGLGFRHVVPCNQQKLMEPFASTVYDTIQTDEKRGAQHNYGDRFAGRRNAVTGVVEGNQTREFAQDLGERWIITPGNPPSDPRYPSTGTNFKQPIPIDRTDPSLGLRAHSVLERDLSTNGPVCAEPGLAGCDGLVVDNPSGQDWFTFEIENPQRVVITADPTGLQYLNGAQETLCSGVTFTVNAEAIGNLNIELHDSPTSATALMTANTADAGSIERLDAGTLRAGRYWIRVYDAGGASTTFVESQPTQLYDLGVRLGPDDPASDQLDYPPYAVAGVDKYAPVGQFVQFIGDLFSRVQEPGTPPLTGRIANYEWDLDGDGEFELTVEDYDNPPMGVLPNNPRFPFITYTGLNDIIPVTLRVTDANGQQATDTIFVTVTGTPITITSVTPVYLYEGTTVPITITGSGLGAITDIGQFSLSNPLITLGGSLTIDAGGTTITGLTLTIPVGTGLGTVDLRITDGCTAGFLNDAFVILDTVPPPRQDVCDMAAAWTPAPGCKPFDNRGATAEVPQDWTGTGCEGQTLYHDVWYTWTSSQTGMLEIDSRSDDPAAVPAPFPTRVAVYRLGNNPLSCPPDIMTLAGCGEMFNISVQYGERLLFRVGSVNEGVPGAACVNLSFANLVGGCCNPNTGNCSINVTPAACNGDFLPSNVCTPNPCPQPLRRCCLPSGACLIALETACDSGGGVWTPNGTTCNPNPCPQPTGSCCLPSGSCTETTQANCSGSWAPGRACSPNPCPQPLGACCLPDGQCVNSTSGECTAGVFAVGEVCTPSSCIAEVGACCVPNQACQVTSQANCPGAWTLGVSCTADPAPCMEMTGACCVVGADCVITTQRACAGGWSAGTLCSPDLCTNPIVAACCNPTTGECILTTQASCQGSFNGSVVTCDTGACPLPRGACCNSATGFCTPLVLQADCSTGAWQANTACTPGLCPQPTGACCVISANVCTTGQTAGQCLGLGGAFYPGQVCMPSNCPARGACCDTNNGCTFIFQANCTGAFRPNTACTPNPCVPPVGACCDGTTCTLVTAANCTAPGVFQGAGSICGTPGNPTTCCPANINGADGVTVQDIFDFLNAYFTGQPAGDFNNSGSITVQDIFDFLAAYFNGCPGLTGACCEGTTCMVVSDAAVCTAGTFQGSGSVCGPTGNPTTCCPANLDGVGGVALQDLFIYLAAYPIQDPVADFNGDGMVAVSDLFAFLQAYFAGCPG